MYIKFIGQEIPNQDTKVFAEITANLNSTKNKKSIFVAKQTGNIPLKNTIPAVKPVYHNINGLGTCL